MKSKKTIIDKTTYGGTLVDKYFLIFDDGTDMQVAPSVWDQYKVGDIFYIKTISDAWEDIEAFDNAFKDIKEGRTIPLDKALNEKPPIDWEKMHNSWKQMHDMQQKLVTHYVLENEKLKDRIKELEAPSTKVEQICNQIEELYKERDYYKMHSHILETANDELTRANKMMKETLINIWECYEIRDEIYDRDWHALQALANKARICLENIGYEWRIDIKDNKS
jgi:hypothetical protein